MTAELPFVIVSHALPAAWIQALDGRCRQLVGPSIDETTDLSTDLRARLAEADGLLTLFTVRIDAALLQAAPRLRVVSQVAVGVDNIDLAACTAAGVSVGHTPGVLTDSTADVALALLLTVARGLPQANREARSGGWTTWSPTRWLGMELAGSTCGIVGMGRIGRAFAQRVSACGMQIVYHSRTPHADVEQALGAVRLPLTELLRVSDVVSLHTPLTAATRHLIDAAALAQMQPHALLINTARGAIVDTAALVAALRDGQIGGAGLDVTDPEPLPPDHALWGLPNCFIAPHIGSATTRTRRRMAELACDNLLAGLAGRRLPHCANPAVYARVL